MERIILTPLEEKVLRKCAKRKFIAERASPEEQDAEIHLIDIAAQYEQEHDLTDERIDYSYDCDLLVWFYDKVYSQQKK